MKLMKLWHIIVMALISLVFNAHLTMAADNLGRLFTTPATRNELNFLRQTQKLNNAVPMVESEVSASPPPAIVLPDAVSMQGYVKRSDGKKSTVWVNNQAVQEGEKLNDVQIGRLSKNSNKVPLKLPANGKNFSLKAGQVYSPANNRVSEEKPYSAQGEANDAGTIGDELESTKPNKNDVQDAMGSK